ncbi:hypothetical protein G7046_g4766 [Stylonectria norvegica]|nr:hypothetical protein G7046_g4766 [Stylonectria norvegica]
MECDICCRGHHPSRLPFVCAVDARNSIYEGRIKNLQLLIENEDLQKQIGALLADTPTSTQSDAVSLLSQQRMAEDKTTQILASADRLRNEIQAAKDEIQARKAALARRRSDVASVSDGISDHRSRQHKTVERAAQMVKYRWSQSAEDMTRTRSFLCMEAARLYGLKRVRKGSAGRYEYQLGKVAVVDLTTMSTLSPEVISTSLGHISHILMLASHYLAIRLPAAITLPHRDYPQPTIFNLSSSYKLGDATFPGQSGPNTPSAEARDPAAQHVPRPRPLFVDRPLLQLSKEDPATYSYFLEGVTLLAYNIAWACSTQGIPIGDKGSFEDICNMGRNLYSLLMTQQTNSGTLFPTSPTYKNPAANYEDGNTQGNWIGRFSHGTTYYFLAGADGTDFTKNFKLLSPIKLADKLKRKLVNDTPAPDWEVLEDDAWKVEGPEDEVLFEDHKLSGKDKSVEGKESPRRGSSGWMKVKSR